MTSAPATSRVGLCLDPLDVLFFRDGRPFGASTRVHSGQPLPQTLAGAICTALLQQRGCDFRALGRLVSKRSFAEACQELCGAGWIADVRVRGPWLARRGPKGDLADVLVPVPAILHQAKDQVDGSGPRLHRLAPLKSNRLPGWDPPDAGLRPLWLKHRAPTEHASGYLSSAGLQTFLDGKVPDSSEVIDQGDLFNFDYRTGIGIDPDRLAAQESLIYAATFLALKDHTCLYAEVILPANAPGEPFTTIATLGLGGEGRRVRVYPLPRPVDWPSAKPGTGHGKMLVLLTTAGLFERPWKPRALDGRLVGAAVPEALAVSGWDLARGGPKPTRFAAPARSVYFLDGGADGLPTDSLADRPEDRAAGWGCYLKGAWTDA